MPKIALTRKAQNDLEIIGEYYADKVSEDFAEGLVAELLLAMEKLELFPNIGRASAVEDTRELVFPNYPFYAAYRVKAGRVQVLRINHQRKQRSIDW